MTKKIWYAPNKFESYDEEEIKAVEDCLRDGWLAGFGKRTVEFEERVSELFGKEHGLFVNSGVVPFFSDYSHSIYPRVLRL